MGKPVYCEQRHYRLLQAGGYTDQAYRDGYGDFRNWAAKQGRPMSAIVHSRPAGRGVMVFAKNQKASLADK